MDKTFWQEFDTDHYLKSISCPVLLIHGEWTRGSCLQASDITRANTYLQQSTIKGFNRVGHGVHQQFPDDYTNVVTTFLNSLEK